MNLNVNAVPLKYLICLFALISLCSSCQEKNTAESLSAASLNGTWRLISSKVVTGKDTTFTYPVKDLEMIKLFNGSHFAFFKHDIKKGGIKNPVFDSGAGTYKLAGDNYEEHLDYCNYREWENTGFKFKLTLKNDTLVQKGIEKIDSLNVNQEITEIYTRVR